MSSTSNGFGFRFQGLGRPKAPSYLNNKFLGHLTIEYIEPRTHYLGNWSPRGVPVLHIPKLSSLNMLEPRL